MILIQLSFNIILYHTILGTSGFLYHYKHNLIINSSPHYLNHTDTDINHKTYIQKKPHTCTNSNIWSAKKCKI